MVATSKGVTAQHSTGDHVDLGGDASVVLGGSFWPGRLAQIELTSGELCAMADFFPSVEALLDVQAREPARFAAIVDLVRRDAAEPGSVTTEEWEAAVPGYADLAMTNSDHFAHSDPRLLPPDGVAGRDHLTEWSMAFAEALSAACRGDAQMAAIHLSWGLHYLTDGFSSGHLFNKDDLAAAARATLGGPIPGLVQAEALDDVARKVWATSNEELVHWGWQVDVAGLSARMPLTETAFRALVATANALEPRLVPNALALMVHEHLGAVGVEVVSDLAGPWRMFGDDHLDATTRAHAQAAVARAQAIVDAMIAAPEPERIAEFIAASHGWFPRITETSMPDVVAALATAEHWTQPEGQAALAATFADFLCDVLSAAGLSRDTPSEKVASDTN